MKRYGWFALLVLVGAAGLLIACDGGGGGNGGPAFVEDCGNGVDDDADALVDCLDGDCPACTEDCANGEDDNGDTLVDCADAASCPPCASCGPGNKVCGSPGSTAGQGACANNAQQAGCN